VNRAGTSRVHHAITGWCVAAMLAALAAPAVAQTDGGRFEVGAGVVRLGHASFGDRDAQETTGTAAGGFRLFASSSELAASNGLGARIAIRVVRSVAVEASATYGTPMLTTKIDADVETSNAPIVASVPVQEFTIGGAALWYPKRLRRLPDRALVFLRGGILLERHLEDRGKRVVDGAAYEAGGGVKYALAMRSSGWWKVIGARGDVFALVRSKALALDGRVHVSPAAGASLFVGF
jgi:hypothetical protein